MISKKINIIDLGSSEFKVDHGVDFAYVTGGMYRGIASKEMVIAMAKSNLLSFFGSGGLSLGVLEKNIKIIREKIEIGKPFGMNFLHQMDNPSLEMKTIDLFLKYKIDTIEASAFIGITKSASNGSFSDIT